MTSSSATPIEFDSDLGPPGTVWVRATAGEVLPGRCSPLTWTLVGQVFDDANRAVLSRDLGMLSAAEAEAESFVGRWQGHFYLNMSSLVRAAGRGLGEPDPTSTGRQAGIVVPLPPIQPAPPLSLRGRLRALVLMTVAVTALPWRRFLQRRTARRVGRRDPSATTTSDLGSQLVQLQTRFLRLIRTHHLIRFMAAGVIEQLRTVVARAGGSESTFLQWTSGIASLESVQPSVELARIASTLQSIPAAAEALATSTTISDLTTGLGPHGQDVSAAIARFRARHGHRGRSEFDPLVPTWSTDDEAVLSLLRSLARHAADRSSLRPERPRLPKVVWRWSATALGRLSVYLIAAGERSKSDALRVVDAMRADVAELRRRLPPEEAPLVPMMSLGELVAVCLGEPADLEVLRARETELCGVTNEPPVVTVAGDPPAASDAPIDGEALVGIGVSAGVIVGRAVVAHDPLSELEVDDIIVAVSTDTAWTPLFLVAGGVVTELGGLASHASIVARELGIPAVVGVTGATRRIRTGDLLEVDGSTGSVRILP